MKINFFRAVAGVVRAPSRRSPPRAPPPFPAVVLFPALPAPPAHAPPPPPFDGKSLTGWTMVDGKPITKGWEAIDGTIHRMSKVADIVTERSYTDFVLDFEVKEAPGTNSGVKYRFGKYGNEKIGMEFQIE